MWADIMASLFAAFLRLFATLYLFSLTRLEIDVFVRTSPMNLFFTSPEIRYSLTDVSTLCNVLSHLDLYL